MTAFNYVHLLRWGAEEIEERAQQLLARAIQIWPSPEAK